MTTDQKAAGSNPAGHAATYFRAFLRGRIATLIIAFRLSDTEGPQAGLPVLANEYDVAPVGGKTPLVTLTVIDTRPANALRWTPRK